MLDVKESQKVIDGFAYRVGRRLQKAGAPMHLIEDVKQECWIAWCKARDSYDEASNASFKTYLWGGMQMHMNNWVRKHISLRFQEVVAKSMSEEIGEEGGATLGDMMPSADPTPEQILERESTWDFAVSKLNPRARQFVEILRNPPELLLQQVREIEARCEFAKERGVSAPFTNRVTTTMVFDLMEATRSERVQIAHQINKIGQKIQRVNR